MRGTENRKVTVHLNVWFHDMGIVGTHDALDTIKLVLEELHHKCENEMTIALEDIGARGVRVETVAF